MTSVAGDERAVMFHIAYLLPRAVKSKSEDSMHDLSRGRARVLGRDDGVVRTGMLSFLRSLMCIRAHTVDHR